MLKQNLEADYVTLVKRLRPSNSIHLNSKVTLLICLFCYYEKKYLNSLFKRKTLFKNILTVITWLLIVNLIPIHTNFPAVKATGKACGLECVEEWGDTFIKYKSSYFSILFI